MCKSVAIEVRPANSEAVHWLRWVVPVLCLSPLIVMRVSLLLMPKPLSDFFTYWSSGHLFVTHGNPYSDAAMFVTQRSLGWTYSKPVVTFCPPWGLPLIAPMSFLPFRMAQSLWFAFSLILDAFSGMGLWVYFGGKGNKIWIAILIALTLIPMGMAELIGQITPLILASLTAFLLLAKRRRYFAAGILSLGFGFKPHLLYLVLLAILLWTVQRRAWTMFIGAGLSYATATIVAFLYNPNSMQYLHRTVGPALQVSCGLGGALRSLLGMDHIWLQFLPTALGLAWFVCYWTRHKDHWDWQIHLPLLLLVSLSTAPYDWNHDYILALPALIAVAVQGSYRSPYVLLAYLGVQMIVFETGLPPVWMAAASALWIAFYWIAEIAVPRQGVSASPLPEGLS